MCCSAMHAQKEYILHEQRIAPTQRLTLTIGSNDLFYLPSGSRLVRICGVVYFRSLGYIDISIYECT